ncbi:MAG: T9SS type A sorting domain-containing protein, partial [Chitinophagales bacterium]|nr:T9SS type A sorting domain-containing protein [Chitinophagales bacterium]
NKSISIFPNPATDVLNCRIDVGGCTKIEIENLLGEKVFLMQPGVYSERKIIPIDIHNYSNGIYFIRFVFENGMVTKMVVKE